MRWGFNEVVRRSRRCRCSSCAFTLDEAPRQLGTCVYVFQASFRLLLQQQQHSNTVKNGACSSRCGVFPVFFPFSNEQPVQITHRHAFFFRVVT